MSTSRQVSFFIQLRDSNSTFSARKGWNRLTEGMDDQAAKCLNLHGVEFDDSGNVIGLDLSNSEIIGKKCCRLSDLAIIHRVKISWFAGLPDTIGDLKKLQDLNLQGCRKLKGSRYQLSFVLPCYIA